MNTELPINEPEEPVKQYAIRVSATCYADVNLRCRESEIWEKIQWMLETNGLREIDFDIVDLDSADIDTYDEVI